MDTVEWLLDSDPAIRWQAMRDLTDASPAAVAAERGRVPREGLAAEILARQAADGSWHRADTPDWLPTLFTLQLLRATGIDGGDPAVEAAVRRLETGFRWDEAFGGKPFFEGEVEPCINGGALALGAYFGRPTESLARRLVGEQLEDGGWNCDAPKSARASFHSTICVLEGLLEYERAVGAAPDVTAARRRGEEYLLERGLFRRRSTGEVANPEFLELAFPPRYHYDVLRALDYLRAAGAPPDARVGDAVRLLETRRQADGRWLLERAYDEALGFPVGESVGEPSRWNTLRALRVLRWYKPRGEMTSRREFLGTVAAVVPLLRGQGKPASEWGAPVFDLHFHLRPQPEANLAHLDGAGVTKANLLTRGAALEPVKALQAAAPGRFTWFASYDVTKPDAEQVLTQSVKDGAQGFGELKFHVAADGPELRRVYALAADLRVPLLIHFQEVDHFPNEGTWSTGYARTFESILKAYPRTTFIGHADAFWANVSAEYRNEAAYPTGPVKRGGITDELLRDYPNLLGDLSANSGNNAMSRDAEFTADFLRRHRDKLLFGSDCGCADGHGGGVSQNNNPAAARMAGKCVARETLTLLKRSTAADVFRKIVWGNAHELLHIPT